MKTLSEYIGAYENNLKGNNEIHAEFTRNTNQLPILKNHRDHIEKYKLGLGDRAFHFMWYLLLQDLSQTRKALNLIEIGVFKGQVISLWSLLVREMKLQAEIFAVSPLEGNVSTNRVLNNRVTHKLRQWFTPGYRKLLAEGNDYLKEDYENIIRSLFGQFNLSFDKVHMLKGFSTDDRILTETKKHSFDAIYVDGDHSYEGVKADLRNFSGLISKGGYLVMDDASWFLEGSTFWKGHKEVSRACEGIEDLGYENVLNVGHNRIYKKL